MQETGEHKMDSPGARLLGSFGFPHAELQHADRVVETFADLVKLLWRIMRDTNDGFAFVCGLPLLDQRDKRTLMAAMLTRSFKFLNAAIELGIRGYYAPCTTLVRCVVEDNLLFPEVNQNPRSVQAFFDDDEDYWLGRVRKSEEHGRFPAVAGRLETLVIDQGGTPGAAEAFRLLYASQSRIAAHPRWPALRLEFDESGTRLMTVPEWNDAGCRQALGGVLIQARTNLRYLQRFVAESPNVDEWMNRSQQTVADAAEWIRKTKEIIPAEPDEDSGA